MKNKTKVLIAASFTLATGVGCQPDVTPKDNGQAAATTVSYVSEAPLGVLPEGLEWITNYDDPIFASPEAQRGGTLNSYIMTYPLTFRTVGPDSNGGFAGFMRSNQLGLISEHPETEEFLPELATEWSVGDDNQTVYYRINPKATWSDGEAVTADDFLFAIEMMRSEYIRAPWYNNYYKTEITDVIKYDDHTISVKSGVPRNYDDLMGTTAISPQPSHFFSLDEDFVRKYNWEIAPVTGPYQISKVQRGRSITLSRVDNWWGDDEKYNQHRFNVDHINLEIVRDNNVAFQKFKRGELDTFGLVIPEWWYGKATGPEFDNGYIEKYWHYHDLHHGAQGIHLNIEKPLLSDLNVRKGIHHAIAIQGMIDTALRGEYARLHNFGTGQGEYTNYDIKAREFNPEKAREYFAAAGFTKQGGDGILRREDGTRLVLNMTYTSQEHSQRLAVLQQQALRAGLALELNMQSGESGFKAMLEKNHEAAWSGWGSGKTPVYRQFLHSSNAGKPQTNNFFNYGSEKMDQLIESMENAFEKSERAEYAKQIQQLIYDEAIFIPGYYVDYTREGAWRYIRLPEFLATKTSGGLFSPLYGTFTGLMWIDQEMKKETFEAKKNGIAFEPVTIINETYRSRG